MELWTLLLQISLIPILIWLWYRQKFQFWSARNIRGPLPLPFFGTTWHYFWAGQVACQLEWARKYGKVYGVYNGSKVALAIADPELIKQVMVKDFQHFVNREKIPSNVHEIWERNLFSINDEDWKRVRRIATPSFTSGKLRSMSPLMNECIDKLVVYLDGVCGEKQAEMNIKEVVVGFTIDVIASTSFGTETNSNNDRSKPNSFVQNGTKLLQMNPLRILALIFLPKFLFPLLGITKVGFDEKTFQFFIDLAKEVIKNRRNSTLSKRVDLVQLLMDASDGSVAVGKQQNLTENEIIAQCILFFIAGFETTASAITHALYELAINPEVQNRLYKELGTSLEGLDSSSLEYHDAILKRSPYLEAVIKETLRKYPPLGTIDRLVGTDGYKLAGVPLQKDTRIHIQTYSVHYCEEYYPKPNCFNPDRFMPENAANLTPYTFLAFGDGPRNCVGMRFAYQEAKLCLAKLLTQFEFSPARDTPPQLKFGKFGMLTVNSIPLKVSKRV